MRKNPKNTDSRTDKMQRKNENLRCSICPPHKHENAGRCAKHGPKKPKYKDKR